MTDKELMQMALDALDKYGFMPLEDEIGWQHFKKTIEALRARLSQCDRCGEVNPAEIHTCTPKPEPAECDGGQCGIGGYCKNCPKTKPEQKIINMENFVGSGKPLVPVCWMNANDIDKTDWKVWAHGKPTISMPLFASPPQREWQGLTREELAEIAEFHFHGALSAREFYDDIEAKLKEKNG